MLKKILKNQKVKIIMFIGILVLIGVVSIGKSYALQEPVKSITITSSKLSYEKREPGSWKGEKSAKWIDKGKAQITFDVDTILKSHNKYTDIIFVLDVSGSMLGDKINRVKSDSIELINSLLSDSNNRASLITFESSSKIVDGLTNDKDKLVNDINNLSVGGNTNYYAGLKNADEILKDYTKEDDREVILLLLTDGYPNEEVPNEVGQYQYLKDKYPYLTINGIQYEMGNTILDPIEKVSDSQYVANMTNLNNVLFDASVSPVTYDYFEVFKVVDYINNDCFTVESVDDIKVSLGSIKLEDEAGVQKVTWEISGDTLKSGSSANMTIDIKLKDNLIGADALFPTNKSEEIISKIEDNIEDEKSNKTPILKGLYKVIYDENAPKGYRVSNVPAVEEKSPFDVVTISKEKPICEGYIFKGWEIVTEDVKRVNLDTFIMPVGNVKLKAVWSKNEIVKSMDGEVHIKYPSVMRSYTSNSTDDYHNSTYKRKITKIVTKDNTDVPETAIEQWDVSAEKNKSVIAYIEDDGSGNGTYQVTIGGDSGKVIANEDSSNLFSGFSSLKEIDLSNLDTSKATNMSYMFTGCGLTSLDVRNFDTSKVTNMRYMFGSCSKLIGLDLSGFDTSNVTNMNSMFAGSAKLTSLDLSNFDTSEVTDMGYMFPGCLNLTSLDLSSFDTGKVTNIGGMFQSCRSLISLDLSGFDTSKVINMVSMFSGCSSLISLDLSGFDFSKMLSISSGESLVANLSIPAQLEELSLDNTKIGTNVTSFEAMFKGRTSLKSISLVNMDASSVTSMYHMFSDCTNLTSINLDGLDSSNVTSMASMFGSCSSLTDLNLNNFDTSKVTDMSYMFYECNSLTSLDVSGIDTSKVTDMTAMFYECSSLTSLDVSNFDTSKVTSMYATFGGCSSLISLDLSNFDTGKVTTMRSMFWGCSSLTSLDLSNFDTSNVTNMSWMFGDQMSSSRGCSSLTSLDLSNFDISNVTTMYSMFGYCTSLTSLDLSSFATSKVTDMRYMFFDCYSLTSLDLSNFDTSKATTMYSIFNGCIDLTSLDLSNFDTSNVTDMSRMFSACSSLTSLDLSNFDTSRVIDMSYMFSACSSLITLDLSNLDTSKVTTMNNMFWRCSSLTSLDLSNLDTSKVTNIGYLFAVCSKLKTAITIRNGSVNSYSDMFGDAATEDGAQITVNYTNATIDLVDKMIATKSSKSNVVKGTIKT